MKKLANFLGVECTDERAKKVMETCSFENMKKADVEFKEKMFYDKDDKDKKGSGVYRKGL